MRTPVEGPRTNPERKTSPDAHLGRYLIVAGLVGFAFVMFQDLVGLNVLLDVDEGYNGFHLVQGLAASLFLALVACGVLVRRRVATG